MNIIVEATAKKSISIKVNVGPILPLGVKDLSDETAAKKVIIPSECYLRKSK